MTLLCHECGSSLWMEGKWCGNCFTAKFSDGREEGQGAKVVQCPCCHKLLGDMPLPEVITK